MENIQKCSPEHKTASPNLVIKLARSYLATKYIRKLTIDGSDDDPSNDQSNILLESVLKFSNLTFLKWNRRLDEADVLFASLPNLDKIQVEYGGSGYFHSCACYSFKLSTVYRR